MAEPIISKKCGHCKQIKPISEFWKNRATKDGYQCFCKKCHYKGTIKYYQSNKEIIRERGRRNYRKSSFIRKKIYENKIKNSYGLTWKEYEQILRQQNWRCAICNKHQSEFKKRLHIDHNHQIGKVRGLLCQDCNTKLGVIEQPKFLKKAFEYLGYFDG